MEQVTGAQDTVTSFLLGPALTSLDSTAHLNLLVLVLESLYPWQHSGSEWSYSDWVLTVETAGPAFEALMDFVPEVRMPGGQNEGG
jgi:hypothetical protein